MMSQHGAPYELFVGVDIAATTFTAAWMNSQGELVRPVTFEQTPQGMDSFQQRLQATSIPPTATLIVMEATGSYWITLAVTVHAAGYQVSVVNPAQIHAFAKSRPRRGKTDALDALLLTTFAVERQPSVWTPPPTIYHEVRQRLMARDALVEMRQQARNQRHALQHWPVVVPSVDAHLVGVIADLDRRIADVEHELVEVLHHGAWAESAILLATIPGIGPLTTAWLLVTTLNFTVSTTATALTSYAGLAPLPRESGTSVRGRRHLDGGNGRLRTALYVATLNAARFNPVIKPFYDRLRAKGKPTPVARCAAARKLLLLARAVVLKHQPFNPTYQQHGGASLTEA